MKESYNLLDSIIYAFLGGLCGTLIYGNIILGALLIFMSFIMLLYRFSPSRMRTLKTMEQDDSEA